MKPLCLWGVLLGALCLPPPAHAASVEIQGPDLFISAETVTVRNEMAVTPVGGTEVRVTDSAGVTAAAPCVAEGPTSARCSTAGVTGLFISLGPLNDELTIGEGATLPEVVVDGGGGRDLIEGSDLGDSIFGFTGADILKGDGGNDFQKGGRGNDTCAGGPGNDDCLGSDGSDRCVGGEGRDECDGGRGRDRCIGGPGVDFGFGCELLISMTEPF